MNLDSFAAHFDQHFTKKFNIFFTIISLDIVSMLNPVDPMKTWGKPYRTVLMKERIKIINPL